MDQPKKPKPKRHHYVPRFYLDYFATEVSPGHRILWVYDKDGGDPRPQTPKDTAVESGFYTIDEVTGQTVVIEESFWELETATASVLERLQNPGAELTEQDILVLTQFLATLHVRGPRMLQVASEFLTAHALHFAKDSAANPEMIRQFLRDKGPGLAAQGKAVPTENELSEILQNAERHFDVVVNRQAALLEALRAAGVIAPILYQMNWCLCRASAKESFITSDSPLCVFVRSAEGRILFGTGFDRPNIQTIFPISPRAAILIDRSHSQRDLAVGDVPVREANRLMAWYAQRFVYSNVRSRSTAELSRSASPTRSIPKLDRKLVMANLAGGKRSSPDR